MKANAKKLAFCITMLLYGCTTGKQYLEPENTLADSKQSSEARAPDQKIEYTFKGLENWKATKFCSRGQSVHNPVVWIPAIGPVIDLIVAPNLQNWTTADAWWPMLPLIGPAIAYNKGALNCTYHSYYWEDDPLAAKPIKSSLEESQSQPTKISSETLKLNIDPEKLIPPEAVYMMISESSKNCRAYKDLVYGSIGEMGTVQSTIASSSSAGAAAAGLAGSAASSGGLALAGLALKGLLDDGINKFFVKGAVENIFDNIDANRTNLVASLTGKGCAADGNDSATCQASNAGAQANAAIARQPFWEYCDETNNPKDCPTEKRGMPFGKFKMFMETLDSACSIVQGTAGVKKSLAIANELLTLKQEVVSAETKPSADSPENTKNAEKETAAATGKQKSKDKSKDKKNKPQDVKIPNNANSNSLIEAPRIIVNPAFSLKQQLQQQFNTLNNLPY